MRRIVAAVGSPERLTEVRERVARELCGGQVRVVVRAADLNQGKARAVSRACHLVQHRGNVVKLRVLYHSGSLDKLRDIVAGIDFPNCELVDAQENDVYVRELSECSVAILPYDQEKYEKRVSGVLHDCAVMGIPAVVPARTTLAECDFATVFTYTSDDDLLGAFLNAFRFLSRWPDAPQRRVAYATHLVARNAISRLLASSPTPSVTANDSRPIVNVVMPLWGRVGSSFAIEGQIRYLLQRGYFVNQIFLLDKPVDESDSIEFFWKMLQENSKYVRGSVQRIGYCSTRDLDKLRTNREYLSANAFDQYLTRISRNKIHDSDVARALNRADVTVVNHVFHSSWARANTTGKTILETHDIQSYQMAAWPLINERTQERDSLGVLLSSEFKAVQQYDHVINVAPEEHKILSRANAHASLVTPYLPESMPKGAFASVRDMAQRYRWHESYKWIEKFDLLIVGDSHPANCESAVWFVKEVFTPYLAPKGYNLALVGRLSDALHKMLGAIPYVLYVGFVEDIDSVKALSKLAVLPDQRGTGISIKTLDAFSTGMPFVATSVALRGIRGRLPADCLAYDEPEKMGTAILTALADQERLDELARLARRCYRAVASKEKFDAAWDGILQRLLLTTGKAVPVERNAEAPGAIGQVN